MKSLILLLLGFGFLLSGPKSVSYPISVQAIEPSGEPDPSPSPTPTPTPQFSCCEKNIKVNQVRVVPQDTVQGAGQMTVTVDFQLDLHWWCDKVANQDCLAYYDVVLENSQWQEQIGKNWVDIPASNIVAESVIPDPPKTVSCDGKGHQGTWSYTYVATIKSINKIRNANLVFDWDIPENKGRSYHSEYSIGGISPTTGTKPPTVSGSHPKQK